MLQPAHVGHLAMLRSLIRQGAQDGSFDPELGASSPEAEAFFAKLKRALVTGYFVEEDGGQIDTVAVPGYVFWPDDRNTGGQPVGFGLFRPSTPATNYGWPASTWARAAAATVARCWRRCSRPRKARRPTSSGSSADPATSTRCSTCSPISASSLRATRRACAGTCVPTPRPTSHRACATPSKRASR